VNQEKGVNMKHGPITCRVCWDNATDDQTFCDGKRSKIVNDPGYWGASDPQILILGMSKGNTQSDAMAHSYASGKYDEVPFKGFRDRLLRVLNAIGLMSGVNNLGSRMTAEETCYGWASIMRCSLTGKKSDGSYGASSAQVIAAMKRSETNKWLTSCVRTHIGNLTRRTRLVVLLSNDNKYMEVINKAVRQVYGSEYSPDPTIGPVVFHAGARTFVHVGHPSPLNGTLGEFLNGSADSGQGEKREMARRGIAEALGSDFGKL
jgi:hypothetical protein